MEKLAAIFYLSKIFAFKFNIKNVEFFLKRLFLLYLLHFSASVLAQPSFTVGIPQPVITNFKEVKYILTYDGEADLLLLDDPSLFTLWDDSIPKQQITNIEILIGEVGLKSRSVIVRNIPNEGVYHLEIAPRTAVDTGDTLSAPGFQNTTPFTIDRTPPEVLLEGPHTIDGPSFPLILTNKTEGAYYTVTFVDYDIWLFSESKVSLTRSSSSMSAAVNVTQTADSALIYLSNPTGNGELGIIINAGSVSDFAGNPSLGLTADDKVIVDNSGPYYTVSAPFNSVGNRVFETQSESFSYEIKYYEPNGLIFNPVPDISLITTDTATADMAIITSIANNTRTVFITNVGGDGVIDIEIGDTDAHDAVDNPNVSSKVRESNVNSSFWIPPVIADNTAPLTLIGGPSQLISTGENVTFTLSYIDQNTIAKDLDPNDINLHVTGELLNTPTIAVSWNYLIGLYEIVLSDLNGDGDVSISVDAGHVSDLAQNIAGASDQSNAATIDTTPPTVAISEPQPIFTDTGPVTFQVIYHDSFFVGLLPEDILLTATGDANTKLRVESTNDPEVINVIFYDIAGNGTLAFSIPEETAIDEFIRFAPASEMGPALHVGNVPLNLSIGAPDTFFTEAGPVTYLLTYAGVKQITLEESDIAINATGTALVGDVQISGLGAQRLITLSDITGVGALNIDVASATAVDNGDNPVNGVTGEAFAVGAKAADQDGDLVPDAWEEFFEFTDKLNPLDYLDTDHDGVPDYVELVEGSDPLNRADFLDTDSGLTPDYLEAVRLPHEGVLFSYNLSFEVDDQTDSDNDGLPDALEVIARYNAPVDMHFSPTDADLPRTNGAGDDDADGIKNGLEFYLNYLLSRENSEPHDDFDRDGYPDHLEIRMGLQADSATPLLDDRLVTNRNGIPARLSAAAATQSLPELTASSDIDADGLPDHIELVIDRLYVNELFSDSDFDGLSDPVEAYLKLLSQDDSLDFDLLSDSDSNGITDAQELALGFHPINDDTPIAMLRIKLNDTKQTLCNISRNKGSVVIEALVANHQNIWPSFDWASTSIEILNIATITQNTLSFDPKLLNEGVYTVGTTLTRTQNASDLRSELKRVIEITDDALRYDSDQDGICDDLDTSLNLKSQLNLLPNQISSDYGLQNGLGDLAFITQSASATVENFSGITSPHPALGALAISAEAFEDALFTRIDSFKHISINNLAKVGDRISIRLPIQASSNFEINQLRIVSQNAWKTFVEDERNQITSSVQACEFATEFSVGIQADSICLKALVVDGGPNDLDQLENGRVDFLFAFTKPFVEELEPEPEPEPEGSDLGAEGDDDLDSEIPLDDTVTVSENPDGMDQDSGNVSSHDETNAEDSPIIFVGKSGSISLFDLYGLFALLLSARIILRNKPLAKT